MRGDKGQFWWELRPCDYYSAFDEAKIVYPDIAKSPRFSLDRGNIYLSNTGYFLPLDDLYLLGVLNSSALWFALSGISIPFGERAGEFRYRLFAQYVEKLPIPTPTDEIRAEVVAAVRRLTDQTPEQEAGRLAVLDLLRRKFAVEKPSQKLQAVATLDADTLAAEVQKSRGKKKPLTAAETKALKDEHTRSVRPLQVLAAEARQLERRVADLVNAAYGLTPEEVALMWRTAPPRMPGEAPGV